MALASASTSRISGPLAGFLFFGFCLIASISSRRFIGTISDKILQRVQEAEETAQDANATVREVKKDVDTMVESRTEYDPEQVMITSALAGNPATPVDPLAKSNLSEDQRKILLAFYRKRYEYDVRAARGISKDSRVSEDKVVEELRELEKRGLVVKRDSRGPSAWGLTSIGRLYAKTLDDAAPQDDTR